MEPKPWYASKTLWVNLISLAVTVLTMLAVYVFPDGTTLPPEGVKVMLIIVNVLNIGLRFITNQPLVLTK